MLNSEVIPTPGVYEYEVYTDDRARAWLLAGPFLSCVGHREAVAALQRATGVRVPLARGEARMERGDEALVCRLASRAALVAADDAAAPEATVDDWELGILRQRGRPDRDSESVGRRRRR